MNIYKWLWSKIGGRPWTFIWRDIYHEAEWLIQIMWLCVGATLGIYFGWIGVGVFIGIYTLGYINGHFHWGTRWIKGQKGD